MSAPSSTAGVLRPDRELLTAWILLFLAHGSGYGYGIDEQLSEQALGVETTMVYRTLRGLESKGYMTSRWIDSHHGPQRRLYSLTAAGRRALDTLAATVAENRLAYQEFVETNKQRSARRHGQRSQRGASALPDAAPRREHDLLVGWLLLVLDENVTYGYDLRRRLTTHHVKADPSRLYRLLRQMEADGRLESRWSEPIAGPKRRLYTATAKGRAHLHEIAVTITQARDVYDAFVDAYEELDHHDRTSSPSTTIERSARPRPQ